MSDQPSHLTYNSQTDAHWKEFFGRFSNIVLMANSDALDPVVIEKQFPSDGSLFIFFNKVYKVLDNRFSSSALLVARSGKSGANIVHRREVPEVLRFFPGSNFLGVVNVRTASEERFSPECDFGQATPIFHVDLEPILQASYPAFKIPTSGYAIVAWLKYLELNASIHLAGFSGRRSEQWKVFDVHDWTFERAYFRLLRSQNRIGTVGTEDAMPRLELLRTHFPDLSSEEIQSALNETFATRLDDALSHVDRLMSVTKIFRLLDSKFRQLKNKVSQRSETDKRP